MSCHEPTAALVGEPRDLGRTPTVALVGNPNVGKSTLFNALTGARQAVVNAPGTTVELAAGGWRAAGVRLLDLPGSYSLLARSPDEDVTARTVAGDGPVGAADVVVVLVDAGALARSLYLVGQVARTGARLVVGVTMLDVAGSRGVAPDLAALRRELGVPVVALDPRSGAGLDELADVVRAAVGRSGHVPAPTRAPDASVTRTGPGAPPEPATPATDPRFADAESLFDWVAQVQAAVAPAPASTAPTRSDRVDELLLRPWVGIPVFLAVMWAVFQLTTTVAAPLIAGVGWLVNTWFAGLVTSGLGAVGAPGWLTSFLVDGLLAGVGTVASFAPLIALMFVAVGLLEDSGYLARAAFVADRAMRHLGLDGRAVLPLVVGFGCNVSALAATRTLPHARQRVLTALLIPYTSCTARLTVYVMLASIFFPAAAGTAIFCLYVASVLLVVLIGLLLRRTAFADLRREPLVLALPAYQRPRLRSLASSTWVRTGAFVTRAGKVIVATLAVVWLLMAVPVGGGYQVADVPVEHSLYGRAAVAVAPVLEPAGFGDWGAASALATGFVAKEVVVGAIAQAYTPAGGGSWQDELHATFERTSGGHAGAAAAAFLVFVLAYTPCLATVAELRRQVGRRWTAISVGSSLVLAWVLAVLVFRVGSLL